MKQHRTEYLLMLLRDARVVELRHQHGDRWDSGRFNNIEDLECAIREREGTGNLYTSLNRPTDLTASNSMSGRGLRDADIGTIDRIVFDLDPRRPTGAASTDAELRSAVDARNLVIDTLREFGWPEPARAVSGNGAHAVYRTCLKSTDSWRQSAATLYRGLRALLEPALNALGVEFDVKVRNPARIWRLYGTLNRKGTSSPDRPHRLAWIELPASSWGRVNAEIIEQTVTRLAAGTTPKQPISRRSRPVEMTKGDLLSLDVVAWFRAHGAYRRQLFDGKHAVRCPWSHEHTVASPESGSDSVVWEAFDRWPTFYCSHAHCDGRSLADVIELWRDADDYCSRVWHSRNR